MTALLALILAGAPGCPAALARAAVPADLLAAQAPAVVAALEEAGAGGPTAAVAAEARALEAAGAEPRVREEAAERFRAALARHCALAAEPRLGEASAADRAALAGVLARPELAGAPGDPYALRRALARLWDWLVELLGTGEAERYASLGRALFLGVAAAAVVLGAWALRRRGRERSATVGGAARAAAAGAAADGSAAEAEEALRRGDGRAAVRLALLAALGALERTGRVPRGRALTNEEVVAAASAKPTPTSTPSSTPTLHADLSALVRIFDRTVYGGVPAAPDDARAALACARRIAGALEAAA